MGWRDVAGALGLPVSPEVPGPPRRDRRREQFGGTERPASLWDMVGQSAARTRIVVSINGARARETHPGHFLFYGPPGLGKTSLAELVASTTGGQLNEAVGSQLNSADVFREFIEKLRWRDRHGNPVVDVLFVDEIHALPRRIAELFYKAMEDGEVPIRVGKGAQARTIMHKLPPYILVGATTLPGALAQPFVDRFETKLSLEYYTDDELTTIIVNAAEAKGAKLDPDAAAKLAKRARSTPRVALRLLTVSWNVASAMAGSADVPITTETVETALSMEEIDSLGLDKDDRALLIALCKTFRGGPVGLENLAITSGIDEQTVKASIEPYLIRAGLMRRTTRGRQATERAYDHLLGLGTVEGLPECPAHCLDQEVGG